MADDAENGLNAGIFFIRVSEASLIFIAECLALVSYHPEVQLVHAEQHAMRIVLGTVSEQSQRILPV